MICVTLAAKQNELVDIPLQLPGRGMIKMFPGVRRGCEIEINFRIPTLS